MKWVFWLSAAVIVYTYVGYALWLWMRSLIKPAPPMRGVIYPTISIVLVVRNEEQVLDRKLRNLLELDYPAESCQIIVVSDGSTDRTETILRGYAANPRVHAVMNSLPAGKAAGLNDAMTWARGEIVVFTDVRQKIERDAVRLLVENFADPSVGCVSGELMLGDPDGGEAARGTGLYWKIEKKIRELESMSGSVIGATGALYAARRELVQEVPAGTILDDVFIPMNVVRQGQRVVFDGRAHAWDVPNLGAGREFNRKVRTLSGNYQLLRLAPWLLSGENPVRFEFVSHKLMRLVVPFALATLLVASVFLSSSFYRVMLACQIAFYALAAMGMMPFRKGPLTRFADAAFTFMMLNTAALLAFANFVRGRKEVWIR